MRTRDDKRFWFNFGDMIRRQDHVMTSLTVDYGDENLDHDPPDVGYADRLHLRTHR